MILAGVIGSEPEPIESRRFGDDVNAAGIGVGRNRNGSYPATPSPPSSTVPSNPSTTDENMIYGE